MPIGLCLPLTVGRSDQGTKNNRLNIRLNILRVTVFDMTQTASTRAEKYEPANVARDTLFPTLLVTLNHKSAAVAVVNLIDRDCSLLLAR